MPDLNANDIEAAMEMRCWHRRSMGVRIEGREMKRFMCLQGSLLRSLWREGNLRIAFI